MVQLSKIQSIWRSWRIAVSRSFTLWGGMFWIPWSFCRAFSRSLVASSISVVVTWQRVICAIDCARRWTAASLIGVGRSIPRDSCLPVCRWTKAFRYSNWCAQYSKLHREWACDGVVNINGRSKVWLIDSQMATGTMV